MSYSTEEINLWENEGLHEKKSPCNHMSTVVETYFSAPKMLDFLILNWGGQLMRTEQLNYCGLTFFPFLLVIPNIWIP